MSGLITLPRMGETMESGRVSAWLKKPGDTFARGETIAEIETDKVTVEMPALDAGRLTEILVPEGSEVAVGEPLGRYDAAGDSGAAALLEERDVGAAPQQEAPDPARPPRSAAQPLGVQPDAVPQPVGLAAAQPDDGRRRATPLARRLARQAGIGLAALAGTGRRGRIEKRDVEMASAGRESAAAVPSSLPEPRFVDLRGGRMAYREWLPSSAVRRTVLLLHGFGADAATWGALAAGLARGGTRVIGTDLPGHGATEVEASAFEAVCDAVADFVDACGLDGTDILGHSMGGAVAARLVASGRLRPASVTLVAPAGLGGEIDADFVHGIAAVGSGGALAHLLRRLARRPPALSRPQLDTMVQSLRKGRLRGLAEALAPGGRQGIDIVADLVAIRSPVRLIWGLDDRIIPWVQVAAAPPRTAIHLIADAGHMPHWDRPHELAALIA